MAMLLQFGGSLLAILALYWIARRLGLGGDARIRSEDDARDLAEEAHCGFEPHEIALDREGRGALLRDDKGRVMVLRRHGAHFAARLLQPGTAARVEQDRLTLEPPDPRFGAVTLDLGPAAHDWATRIGGRG